MSRFKGTGVEDSTPASPAQLAFTVVLVATACIATQLLAASPAGVFALSSGVAFALLLRFGRSAGPAIFIAAGLSAFALNSSPRYFLLQGAALTLEVIPAVLPLPLVPMFRMDRPRDAALNLLFLILVAFPLATALRALAAPHSTFADIWLAQYLMDAGGLIVIGLPLLFWRRSGDLTIPRGRRAEAIAAAALLILGSAGVFSESTATILQERMLAYVPVLAVLWLSLRFHVLAASASLLFLVSVAWIGTAHGQGPIAASPDSITILRIYLITLSLAVFFIVLLRNREGKEQARRLRSDFRFRLMAERSREIVFRIRRTPELAFEFISPSIRELTGRSHQEFLADPVLTLQVCHPEDRPLMQYALHTDEPELRTELRWKNLRGEYRWVELYQVALFDRQGRVIAIEGTGRDVTDRKHAEANILHLNRLLMSLREIGQLLAREHSPGPLLDGVCGILVRNRGYHLVWIGTPGDGGLVPVAAAGDSRSWLEDLLPGDHDALLGPTVEKPWIQLSSERASSDEQDRPGIAGDKQSDLPGNMFSVPLQIEGRCYGWMSVCADSTRIIDQEEKDLLSEMGQDIAYGLSHMEGEEERKRALDALQTSEEQYRRLVEEAAEGIFVVSPEGTVTGINPFGCSMLGFERNEILGKPLQTFFSPEDLHFYPEKLRPGLNLERRMIRSDGTAFEVEINTSILPDGSVQGLVRDVSERRQAEREIERLAFFDPLTGLANRRLLRDRLERDMAFMRRKQSFSGLLFLDLDHFKHINDSLGHNAGDRILQQVADRLRHELRAEDTVARLGGDEFVALLFDLAGTEADAARQAQAVAEKILTALTPPYSITDGQFFITPSIGITVFPRPGQTIDDVLREADTAMYRSKVEGRNGFRFFHPDMQMAAEVRVSLELEMRRGIQAGEFVVYYQRQVDCTGHLCGMEALIRWQHPERGVIFPGTFISVAEETGLIVPLGAQLLELACRQMRRWTDRNISPPALSVNISARQFQQEDFVRTVREIIQRTEVSPRNLIFEITESVFIDRIDESIAKMRELRDFGIRFSIDDFGTGYSSLTYLKRLPLDEIKIDRSFVQDSSESDFSRSIIRAILTIAHHLDMTVVAEGVESKEQQDLLNRLGCRRFQGFLYGQPVPGEKYEQEMLASDMNP